MGLFLHIVGSLCNSVSLLMMKRSADTEAGKPLCHRTWWLVGFSLLMANALMLSPRCMRHRMLLIALITMVCSNPAYCNALSRYCKPKLEAPRRQVTG